MAMIRAKGCCGFLLGVSVTTLAILFIATSQDLSQRPDDYIMNELMGRSPDWPYDAYSYDVVTNEDIITYIREYVVIPPPDINRHGEILENILEEDVQDMSEGSLISNWVFPALFANNTVRKHRNVFVMPHRLKFSFNV